MNSPAPLCFLPIIATLLLVHLISTLGSSIAPAPGSTQADTNFIHTKVAISVSLSRARNMSKFLFNISTTESHVAAAVRDCCSVFSDAVSQIHDSLDQMSRLGQGEESVRFKLSNVQTWMSAALTNEETCTDGFQGVADGEVKAEVCDRAAKVKKVTSNALALVNSYVWKVAGH